MNRGFRLTPAMVSSLVEGYKNGKTTTILASEYKISKASVCRALRKMGVEPERKDNLFQAKEFSLEEEKSICIDYRAGLKITDLIKKYNSNYEMIVRLLEADHLYKRSTTKLNVVKDNGNSTKTLLTDDDRAEICELYEEGSPNKVELAKEFNVHVDTITSILNKAGIRTKRYIPAEVIEAFCEEFAGGMVTIADLARIYEKNPDTIRYWLTKEGLIDTTDGVHSPVSPTLNSPITAAKLRNLARSEVEDSIQTLKEIRDNVMESGKTRAYVAQILIDRAFGKPREEKDDDRDTTTSTTAKILQLVGKDLVKKS